MKVSQLLHAMDKDEEILIDNDDVHERITQPPLYEGNVRGIKRDDPINRMHINHIFAHDSVMVVLVERKGEK